MPLTLRALPATFYIYRLPPNTPLPSAVLQTPLVFVAHTPEETSLLAPEGIFQPAEGTPTAGPWKGWQVQGPLDFGLVGILAQITAVLAAAEIPILAVSTFDTDYLWVPQAHWENAQHALRTAGYRLLT
ncbi:MAG: ACT domain-containing protein [Chloroflexi bacterium]|nr:ACT domain-containing protein [Chloroflexota bacterium]